MPGDFQPAAASFRSPASGVVLGGVSCTLGHANRALLAATADGGAHCRVISLAVEGIYHSVKEVLLSVNGGRTEHLTGQGPGRRQTGGVRRAAVITIAVVTPSLDYFYHSADWGRLGPRSRSLVRTSRPGPGGPGGSHAAHQLAPCVGRTPTAQNRVICAPWSERWQQPSRSYLAGIWLPSGRRITARKS